MKNATSSAQKGVCMTLVLFAHTAHTCKAPPGFFNFFLQLQGKNVQIQTNFAVKDLYIWLASVRCCLPASSSNCKGSPGLLHLNLFLFTIITSHNTDLSPEHLLIIQLSSSHVIA